MAYKKILAVELFKAIGKVFNLLPDEGKREAMQASFWDFFSGRDEAIFMNTMSRLHLDVPGGEEAKKRIQEWLSEDENRAYLFRKFLTAHTDLDARLRILISYAKEENNEERTKRFQSDITEAPFIKVIKKKLKDFKVFNQKIWDQFIGLLRDLIGGKKDIKGALKALDENIAQILQEKSDAFWEPIDNWIEERRKIPRWKRILWFIPFINR